MCLKSRDQQVNHIYIQTAMCKPHGNNKPKIYNTHTEIQILKIGISSQGNKAKKEQKNYKNKQKTTLGLETH